MSKRVSSTPLYEMMVRRSDRAGGPGGSHVGPDPRPADVVGPHLGGRSVRVPIGYLLVGTAAVLFALVVAYMLGASRGEEAARAEYDDLLAGGPALSGGPGRALDPLQADPADPDDSARGRGSAPEEGAQAGGTGGGDGSARTSTPPAEGSGGDTGGSVSWGPIESDPRQPGRQYLVLVETRPEGAVRLAEFCRAQGLEAYVVRRHNARFARVIVLPGFESRSSMSDPDVRRVMQDVLRIGLAWKSRYPAESDLKDAYLSH